MALKKTVKAKSNKAPKQTTPKDAAASKSGAGKPKSKPVPASQSKPAISKSIVAKPQVSSKPVSVKVASSKPIDSKPVESKPVDAKSVETKTATVSKPTDSASSVSAANANKKSIIESNRPPKSAFDEELTDLGPFTVAELRKVKTGLARKDLDEYKQLLLEKRAELLGDVASLETDARNHADGNSSNMPDHMADVGSDNYEQEFTLGLVESERRLLAEINASLRRIRENIYGICLETGVPISRARLDIKPWAKYCIEVERNHERRHRR